MPSRRVLLAAACAAATLGTARAQTLFEMKTSANASSIAGTNWTTPTNIQTDNNIYAVYTNTAQNWLIVKTFGFAIPTAAVIDGIEVVTQGHGTQSQVARREFDGALTKDGTNVAGAAKLALVVPQTTDADVAISTPGAQWTTSWTPADINSANFGAMIRDNDTSNHEIRFDTMTVTVRYRTIDTITVTPTALAPGTIAQGSDYAVERLALATNANTAAWTALTVAKTGTLADGSVTAVKIYLDDGDGVYDAGDTLISSGANTFTAGSAAITLTAPQTITTTSQSYFIVYTLGVLATVGNTIGSNVASNASFTVTYPDTTAATNLPAASGTSTITDGADTITVTPTDQAAGTIAQSSDYSVERLSLATNQETATLTALTVTKTGTLADAKITSVKIYLDANANGTYQSGTDTLISAAETFTSGTSAITLTAAQTITTTPKVYFVVYTLAATATVGATVGASIASNAALTVTAPDLVAATNLPANSTNSSVTDVADTITVTPTDVAPGTVVQGADFALEKLSLATAVDEAVWTAVTVAKTGTLADNKVTTVKIYLDDGSGSYDGGDTLISPGVTTFSGGSAAITLSAAQTITTTPKVYFVVYTLDPTAPAAATIGASVASNASLTVTAPDLVSASNFPASSSNASVISAGDTVTATRVDLAPGTLAQGTANTAIERLSLVTNANSATWTDITVTKSGTLPDADVTTVKIYLDANANGTFESGSDTLISPAVNTFSAGLAPITLSAAQTINTTPKLYFIVYTLEALATPGGTIGASVASNAHLSVNSPDIVSATNFPLDSTNATVTDVADTVTVTPTSMAPGSVDQATDYAVEKLSMATGADEAVWTALTVTKTGTLADGDVTTVKVYLDANANGTYEAGSDTLISPGVTTFSGGAAAITLSASQTLTTTPKVYFIVYALSVTATAGNTIGARVAASGDVTLTAPDLVSGTFPMNSANSTVADASDVITVTPTDMAPGTIPQDSDYAVQKLSLVTAQETALWTALTVAKTGTIADADITAVKLYLDANANGTYQSGTDTLITSGADAFTAGSAALSLTAAQTITTTPKVYFIVYVLDLEATIGATAGASVASNASFTVTAPDAVAATNLPANSSNSTVTDLADTAAVTATDVAGTEVGQAEVKAFLKLSMATAADAATWTALTVTKTGNLADGSVTTVRVFLDDGDDLFGAGVDTLISPGVTTFTGGSAAITLSASQALTATPKVYFVVYTIALGATVGNTIGARVTASGDFTATAPDGFSGTFPMNSAVVTVAAPDVVTASRTNLAPATIGQGADYAVEKLSLLTDGNTASMTAIKVTLSGTLNRTNVTAVKIYADDGGGDYGNEDTLLGAGTFGGPGTVSLTLTPAQTLTTSAQDYYVVYTLAGAAPLADTVGASIAAATDVTIASPDTIATTNFPLSSTNSSVDTPDYGVTISPNLVTVGDVALNQNYVIATGITVTSVGNMGTTYEVKATTVTLNSPWVIALSPGTDQYTMQALFNTVQPGLGDYTASDKVLDSGTLCLGGKFEGNQGCQSVRPGNVRTLWMNIGMPIYSTTQAVQDFQINVTATVP